MAGPNPTFNECWSQLGKLVKIVDELYKFGSENGTNYVDLVDAFITSLDGEYTPLAATLERDLVRSRLQGPLTPATLRALFRPFFREMARARDLPFADADDRELWRRVRQSMIDAAPDDTLNSREMTLGTPTAITGTGTGVLNRLTTDKDGYTLECTGPEVKTLLCLADGTGGGRLHRELFELRGTAAGLRGLQWEGSGGIASLEAIDCLSAGTLVNPSFETNGSNADGVALPATTTVSGWTVTTAANWKTRTSASYVYRGYVGQPTTLYGLECTASDQIAQTVRTANPGAAFDERVPYYLQVAVQRKSSATGTVTLHLGGQTTAVDLTTLSNDTWAVLRITLGTKNWYQNFRETDLDVKIVVASLAVGTVVIDDVVLAPMTLAFGSWWALVGGATAFLRGDTATATDTDGGSRAKNSYWLWRATEDDPSMLLELRGWWPTTAGGTETIADV